MAADWWTPLVISALRLVMISALLLVNAGALWQVSTRKCNKGTRNHERFSIITILFLNIIYLLIIWAPFSVSAFRQDVLNGASGMRGDFGNSASGIKEADASDFVVEYIDLRTGKVVAEEPDVLRRGPRAVQEKEDDDFNVLPSLRIHYDPPALENDSSQPAKHPVTHWSIPSSTKLEKSRSSWNTDIQDLETSSCAYSLALTGIVRMVITKRPSLRPTQPLFGMIGSLLLVIVPAIVTGLTRIIGGTAAHFALHEPDINDSGFAIYNIICDVHITEAYVLSLFLEWVVLFTLAIASLGLGLAFRSKDKTYNEDSMKTENPGCVETWARDFVLVLGAVWAWPVKPLFVLILYCQYGSHWTNVVCWLANAVVAIPVVLMPQAIFLSRFQKKCGSPPPISTFITDRDIVSSEEAIDPREERDGCEGQAKASDVAGTDKGDAIPRGKDCPNFMAVEYGQDSRDAVFMSPTQLPAEGKNYAQANLKFYLGTDILKHGKMSSSANDDERITLKNDWNPNSEV
ncbi:uncharacterized protein [Panulirus ornatus]|uniref:uncharacterized protein n=1 Tax=Panulirus ornatus TaxID=150431 RepID=UPI003A89D874